MRRISFCSKQISQTVPCEYINTLLHPASILSIILLLKCIYANLILKSGCFPSFRNFWISEIFSLGNKKGKKGKIVTTNAVTDTSKERRDSPSSYNFNYFLIHIEIVWEKKFSFVFISAWFFFLFTPKNSKRKLFFNDDKIYFGLVLQQNVRKWGFLWICHSISFSFYLCVFLVRTMKATSFPQARKRKIILRQVTFPV